MLPKFMKSGSRGFSLVELMIVVAIIGVLSALAVPRFQKFQAKAKQSEAKTNLSHIYTLAQSYYGDNDTYNATFAQLGFVVDGGTGPASGKIYNYTYAGTDSAFTGTATAKKAITGGCAVIDVWTIDQNKAFNTRTATNDGVVGC